MRKHARSRQRGSALIEFVLGFSLIAMLAIGAASFGLAIQKSIVVADAASNAAMMGANDTYNITYTSGMKDVASNVGYGVVSRSDITPTYFCSCTAGGSIVACTSSCSNDQPLYYVKVVTSTSITNFFNYFGMPSTFTLNSSTVMPAQ